MSRDYLAYKKLVLLLLNSVTVFLSPTTLPHLKKFNIKITTTHRTTVSKTDYHYFVRQWWPEQSRYQRASEQEISKIVDRLYKQQSARPPTDSRRISTGRIKEMGIINSYAWKGYN